MIMMMKIKVTTLMIMMTTLKTVITTATVIMTKSRVFLIITVAVILPLPNFNVKQLQILYMHLSKGIFIPGGDK